MNQREVAIRNAQAKREGKQKTIGTCLCPRCREKARKH